MAILEKFIIENFRGIEKTEISLCSRVNTPIITLVGLNESGKTTILEALSLFVTGDQVISKMFEDKDKVSSSEALSVVPIDKKANYTGVVKIAAKVKLEDDDIALFSQLAKKASLILDEESIDRALTLTRQYTFVDGNLDAMKSGSRWTFSCKTKSTKAGKSKDYVHVSGQPNLNNEIWVNLLKRLPSISYFPTFLVNLPERIYLAEHANETPENRHYRAVLQDVLDSLNDNLSLETHIVQRINDFREEQENPNWISLWWGSTKKSQAQAVIQKMSTSISAEIIGSWNKIFRRPTSAKSISLEFNIDTEKENLPYVSFQISDGAALFNLHERSLGFRWFFSFLLFTRFKKSSNRPTIFLFDEPAANLHARAQSELLESFERILDGGHSIIYSTHSHHMINPKWLSGAYIIENKAIDYDNNEEISYLVSRKTNISAILYKHFVSQFPDRVSYYQPILERLGYENPKIIPEKPIVITEGISDYHAFKAIGAELLASAKFEFIPGMGATSNGPYISFMMGTGKPFLILLDDDKAGREAESLYMGDWFLPKDTVLTLKDVDAEFEGMKLETLISTETHEIIAKHFSKQDTKATKKEIGIFFSEKNYGKMEKVDCSEETRLKVNKIINYLNNRFD